MNYGQINSTITRDRDGRDHFVTPEYAVEPLIKHIPKDWQVWECTDGALTSGITSALRKHGCTVVTNKDWQVDFIEDEMPREFMMRTNAIITNPPFNQKDAFIGACMFYACKYPHLAWGLLLPLTALEGVYRGALWDSLDTKLQLLVLNKRVEYIKPEGGGSNWFNSSWFTYNMNMIDGRMLLFEQMIKVG